MAKAMRRRSSSMRPETYWRLLQLVRKGIAESGSAIIERTVNDLADAHGIRKVSREEASSMLNKEQRKGRPPGPVPKTEEIVSQHFTF